MKHTGEPYRIRKPGAARLLVFGALALALYGALLLAPAPARADPGDLDFSFGRDGVAVTPAGFGVGSRANAVAIQANGRIVVAGGVDTVLPTNTFFMLTRYNTDGTPDRSFGGDGIVTTDFGVPAEALAVAIQKNGKIVAAGYAGEGSERTFALARYNANGTLDASFGRKGRVSAALGGGDYTGYALAIQPNGKIVVAGAHAEGESSSFALARYNSNGRLDPSFQFGTGFLINFGGSDDRARALALQPDGGIVVAGFSNANGNYDFALAEVRADGSGLNTSFGGLPAGPGKALIDFFAGHDDQAYALQLLPVKGKKRGFLYIAGSTVSAGRSHFALAACSDTGELRHSLGGQGTATVDFGGDDGAAAIAISYPKLLLAGTHSGDAGVRIALAQFDLILGGLDPEFGGGHGKVTTPIPFAASARGAGVAVAGSATGKNYRIVVAGTTEAVGEENFAVVRYQGKSAPGHP
jgi:uncharacterized delta-60 repeat protein